MHRLVVPSPLGPITLVGTDTRISELRYGSLGSKDPNPLLVACAKELADYFAGTRRTFTTPLDIDGTDFDYTVLAAIRKIPYGKTASYGDIAKKIGKPTAYRAVANACGRNKLPVLIPCHRVVATNGLGGYNGGTEKKQVLLKIEEKHM